MKNLYGRLIALIGERAFDRLRSANVLIVGLGGVGGAALETLARYGVGKLTLVDGDVFEESNLNRQILATVETLGKNKADAAADRIKHIAPFTDAVVFPCYYNSQTAQSIMSEKYDYCIDAIDDIQNKIALISDCAERGIPVISAMGAGNRLDCEFKVTDIQSTAYDGFARTLRKKLREIGISNIPVVCACAPAQRPGSEPVGTSDPLPSCAAPPIVMGAMLAGHAAKAIMGV